MPERGSLPQRQAREGSGSAPALPGVGPKTPALVPANMPYSEIPEKFRAMIAEIIGIITANREPLIECHLRLVYAKFTAANFLMRLREFRQGLIRAMREAPPEPAAARAAVEKEKEQEKD